MTTGKQDEWQYWMMSGRVVGVERNGGKESLQMADWLRHTNRLERENQQMRKGLEDIMIEAIKRTRRIMGDYASHLSTHDRDSDWLARYDALEAKETTK